MTVLHSHFAGQFYTQNSSQLTRQIQDFLSVPELTTPFPKAIIVPHAGYIYSGQTAAYAYKQLSGNTYSTAVLMGPSHQVPLRTLSIPQETAFLTPLGQIPFNTLLIDQLVDSGLFVLNSVPHLREHSLEVQYPFLQIVQPGISIVPISVGHIGLESFQKAGQILFNQLSDDTILIISTDLSHYHPLSHAKSIDQQTIQSILSMDASHMAHLYDQGQIECCGILPLILGMETLSHFDTVHPELLNYDTSATTSFDNRAVVGYTAISVF